MREERSYARKSEQNLASRAGRRHFVREGHTDARKLRKKLASRTTIVEADGILCSDARKSVYKLASRQLRHRRYITGGRERREGGNRVGREDGGDGERIKEGWRGMKEG